jgi:hypothetical protein
VHEWVQGFASGGTGRQQNECKRAQEKEAVHSKKIPMPREAIQDLLGCVDALLGGLPRLRYVELVQIPGNAWVRHEQPFDSVLLEFGNIERKAGSGLYLLPIVFGVLNAIPLSAFVGLLLATDAPLPFCLIPLAMSAVFVGVAVHSYRKLQRYRFARAALQTWAQSHGFAARDRAYVGVVRGRRCAAFAIYRREGKTEYVFECFALLMELTTCSSTRMNLYPQPRTTDEVILLLNSGLDTLLHCNFQAL